MPENLEATNAETHSSLNKKNEKHKKYKYPQSITLVLFMGSYLHPLIYSKVAKSEKRAQIGSVLRETLRSYQYIFLMLSDSPVQKKCDTSLPVCRDDCKGHQWDSHQKKREKKKGKKKNTPWIQIWWQALRLRDLNWYTLSISKHWAFV